MLPATGSALNSQTGSRRFSCWTLTWPQNFCNQLQFHKGDSMQNSYEEDPEMGDENDPEYKAEMFETFRYMNVEPEELPNPAFRAEYVAWLMTKRSAASVD